MSELAFPTVSFQPFLSGTEKEQRETAQCLYDAFHSYGWVYLTDFGISKDEVDKMWSMSKTYFDQPIDKKLKDTLGDPAVNQGYTPDGKESELGLSAHKESYEHRRFHNESCPSETELPGFKSSMDDFYAVCHGIPPKSPTLIALQKLFELASHVLRALALILDLPATYFEPMLAGADHQLRILHYMQIPKSTIEAPGHSRMYPHTDFGFCTILFQDDVGGLEVDRFHTDDFVPATPVPGSCVINVADLLQRLSNDRLRSTRHRVTAPKVSKEVFEVMKEGALLPARYSTAFFVHPGADVVIAPIVMEDEGPSKYESVVAGEWRTRITANNYNLSISPGA